jgi:aminoglycoside phosphotransferase (APT) family kinase protein
VQVHRVTFTDASGTVRTANLLTKHATLYERRILALLTRQGHRGVPFCHTLDLATDGRALVCQQHIPNAPYARSSGVVRRAALSLAEIHFANLGQASQLDWVRRADRSYLQGHVANSRLHWERTLEDDEFAREYGKYTQPLEAAGRHFVDAMEAIWQQGDSLTLIHADVHPGHVLVADETPYFIDWDQARYGSLYLDLPNYFTLDEARLYSDALASLGYGIPEVRFVELYREASRYKCFKYLPHVLWLWRLGGDERTRGRSGIAGLLESALPGLGLLHG